MSRGLVKTSLILLSLSSGLGCQGQDIRGEREAVESLEGLRSVAESCLGTVNASTVPKRLSQAITACLAEAKVSRYALKLNVLVHPKGLRLESLQGADPVLSQAISKRCLTELVTGFRTPAPTISAGSDATLLERHMLEISKDSSANVRVWRESMCSFPNAPVQEREPFELLEDSSYLVGIPWTEHEIAKGLLACDTAQKMPKDPEGQGLLFGLQMRRAATPSKEHCATISTGLAPDYSQCICKTLLKAWRPAIGPKTMTMQLVTTKANGSKVTEQVKADRAEQLDPERIWVLRRMEADGLRYRGLRTPAANQIPVPLK